MAIYGKSVSTPVSPSFDTIPSGTCRATSYYPMVGNGWATSVGGHVGRSEGDDPPQFRYGVHVAVNGSPDTRVAYTVLGTVNSFMLSGNDGALVRLDFDDTNQAYSPRNDALALFDGTRYSIDALPTGGDPLCHGRYPASSISEAYESYYEKTGNTIPPDPFNETSIVASKGWMTFWINYDPNDPPYVPINRTPHDTITDTTPHMQGDFRDLNGRYGTDRGDRMSQFKVQARKTGTSALLWDSTQNASQAEKDNDRFDTIYAGGTLLAGTAYQWRCQVADHFGVWSGWSEWLDFDLADAGDIAPGVVTLVGVPSGTNQPQTGNSFQARYTHSTGLAGDQTQIELYQGSTLVDSSPVLSKAIPSSAAPGTLFSITQSEAGFGTLADGVDFSYRIRARSTNGNWSTWTAKQAFKTGAAPFKPDIIEPKGSTGVSDYPLLQCSFTDPDGFVGLTGYCDIMSMLAPLNRLFNGDTTSWTLLTAAGVTAALAYDASRTQDATGGSGKVQITASTAPAGSLVARVRNDRIYPVLHGQNYSIESYLQVDQANLHMGIFIDWFSDDAASAFISTSYTATPAGTLNAWGYRTDTFTAPSTAVSMKVGYCVKANAANQLGSFWGDSVTTPNWAIRYRRDLTHQGEGLWTYQTTAIDLPAYATYHWRARGYDSTQYSPYSDEVAFIYAAGPVVAMLTPVANSEIPTSTPEITWSVLDQQRFQVQIWLQTATGGTGQLIFTGEEVTSTVSRYVMPAGYLRNDGRYRVRVTVWNSLNQEGISPNRNFGVDYGVVIPLTNVFASPYSLRYDPAPSAILITWDVSYYPASQHEAYAIYRRESTQPSSYNLLLGRFSSVGQTSFIDYQPASGIEYIYTVTQMVRVGIEVIESIGTEVQESIELRATVLSAADDGDTYRVVAQFWSERSQQTDTDGNQILPWGSTKPTMLFGSSYFKSIHFTARFVNTDFATIQQMSLESDRLLARRGIVCFRDPKGRIIFGVLSSLGETDEASGTLRSITYELTQVNYTEAYT